MLELKNLSKKYDSAVVLDGVSLSLEKGEVAILLGHSGVGKSTLLRVLSGLERVDSGLFSFEGGFCRAGMVFQEYGLFTHLTAKKNLTLPFTLCLKKSKEEADSMADSLLAQYNLQAVADKEPKHLSGGQKQRLAIARAMGMGSSILCMDEPTSALDPKGTLAVASQIEEIANKGHIVLVATHDITLIDKLNCTIYLMEKGKVVEKASSKEFFAKKESYPAIAAYIVGER